MTATIGARLLSKEALLPGEQVVHEMSANRTQSGNRAVGGKLYVTTHRLVFLPHLIDANTGGQKWSIALGDIGWVTKHLKGGDTFGGGLRDRLCITRRDGVADLFVINKLDETIAWLLNYLRSPR